jgi:hypothetical protein
MPPADRQTVIGSAERQEEEADRFTRSLAGFAVALLLGILGFYLIVQLRLISKVEDCLLQGRLNCERIELSGGPL